MNSFLSLILFSLVAVFCTSCESVGNGSENNTSSASAIPWNKPASWEGAGALGGLGFQGTH
jgi:hypothetical protein